jgi:hypothetical protein
MFQDKKKSKKTDQNENQQEEDETSREYQVLSHALGQDATQFNNDINIRINLFNNFRKKLNDIKDVKIVKENEQIDTPIKAKQSKKDDTTSAGYFTKLQEMAAASGAPDDDGDDQNNINDTLFKIDNLKTLQYYGEIDVNEIKQVEIYYEKIKDKNFKMNYETGTLSEIQGVDKNRFQYLGVWSSMSGSILVGRVFLPFLGSGLKSFVSKFLGQDGAIYEFSEKMAKGIPFSGSETIGGISGINAYVNIYFFLNAATKSLQNGNPDYLLRYLAQNGLQKVLSMVLFKGVPLLVGMTSMPVLLSSAVASALPIISPLSAITQKIFTSDAAQMGVSMGSQWVGTMIIGEFMNYRFKELAETEAMEKEMVKKQQSDKRKRESFKKMMQFMEEQKHDQITDRLIRGEYNLMDKIQEVANDNSGLIGFLLAAVGAAWGLGQMGLYQSSFWKEQVIPSKDELSVKLEEMLDINTKTFSDTMIAFLIPLIQKQIFQQFEIREKIQKRVNEIIREKVIPYLKEFQSLEKLSKWNMFKEITVLRYILIEKMRIKSLEYYTVEKLFESMTTNNITQMVYGQVEDLATNGLQYIDEEGEKRHVFGSLSNPATFFGATQEEKEGHWAEGSVSALRKVETMIGNHWVSGFDDLNAYTQKLGRFKLSIGDFQSFLARWSGTETDLTQESDANVLKQISYHLWKDNIIPHDFNLDSIQTVDDLKNVLADKPLTKYQRQRYVHMLPLDDLSIENIKKTFQSPSFLMQHFMEDMADYMGVKVRAQGGGKRKINLEVLFFGVYPESMLRKFYSGDDLESKIQQGKKEFELLNEEYSESVKNIKAWAPKLKPFWANFSDFKTNALNAAAKSRDANWLKMVQDTVQKATQKAELAKLQPDKQIEADALSELARAQEQERIAKAVMKRYEEPIYDGSKQSIPDDIKAHELIFNMSKSILRFYLPKSFFQIKEYVSNGFYLDVILKSLKNMFLDFWKKPSSVRLNMSAQEYLSRMTQLCSRTNVDENKSCEVFAFEKLIEDTGVSITNAETWKNLSDQDKLAFFNSYFSFLQTGDFNFILTNFKDYLDPSFVDKMTALQSQDISIFPKTADKPEDGLDFYDAFKRPIFKKASEMGEFASLGSVSEFIDTVNDFFKNLTGSGFDAEFTRNTMNLYGSVGHKSDPRFLSEIGIPITQGDKKGDVSYVLGSLLDSKDFKGVDWETLSGPDGERKAELFVEFMKYHAYIDPEDLPFDVDKFSALNAADKLKAVQLYFKLFKPSNLPEKTEDEGAEIKQQRTAREEERNRIYSQLMGSIGYESLKGVFKGKPIKYIVDEGKDYNKYYNFFTGAFFKTYKTKDNTYAYTGFRKLVEGQRAEIKRINKRLQYFVANYCLDDTCKNNILNPPDNVSLTDHIEALEKIFDGKLTAEQQRAGYIFMFRTGEGKPPGVDLSKNTPDIIRQIETEGGMNVEQQIAYFEKQVGKLVSIGKKRTDYLIELIDTFKTKRSGVIEKLKPFFCKLDGNCDLLYNQINYQFLKNIDAQQMIQGSLESDATSLEQLNLLHSDLGTFFLNFRGSTVEDLTTYENMIANFNGKTIEEFQTYLQNYARNGTDPERKIAAQVGQVLPLSTQEMNRLIQERNALRTNTQLTPEERAQKSTLLDEQISALESKSGLKGLIERMKDLITKKDALIAKPILSQQEKQEMASLISQIDSTIEEINTKFGSAIRGNKDAKFAQRIRTRFEYTFDGFVFINTDEEENASDVVDPSIAEKLSQKQENENIPRLMADWDIKSEDLPSDFNQLSFSQKMAYINSKIDEKIRFINNLPEFIIPCLLNKECKTETFIDNQKHIQYPISGSNYKQIMNQLNTLYTRFYLNDDSATPDQLDNKMRTAYGREIELLVLKRKYPIKSDEALTSLKNCDWVISDNVQDELVVFKAYDSMIISLKTEYDAIPSKYPVSFSKDILSKPFNQYKPHEFKKALAKLNDRVITYDDKCAFLISKGISIQCSHTNEEDVLHKYQETSEQIESYIKGYNAAGQIIGVHTTIQTQQLTLAELKDLFDKRQIELDQNNLKINRLKAELGIDETPGLTQNEKINWLQQRFNATQKEIDNLILKMSSSSIYRKKIEELNAKNPSMKVRKDQMQLLWNTMTSDAIVYGYKGDTKGLTGMVYDEVFKKYQNGFLDKLILLSENGYDAEVRNYLTGIHFSGDISQLKSLKDENAEILQHLSLNEIMNAESKLKLIISLKQLVNKNFQFKSSGNLDTDLEQLKQYESLMHERIGEWSKKWNISASNYETKPLTDQYTFLQNIHEKNAAAVSSMNELGFFKTKFEENFEGLEQIKALFYDSRFTSNNGSAEKILLENEFPNPAIQLLKERIQLFDTYSRKFPPKKSIAEYQNFEKQLIHKASKVSTLLTVQSGPAYGNVLIGDKYYKIADIEDVFEKQLQKFISNIDEINGSISEKLRLQIDPSKLNDFDYLQTLSSTLDGIQKHQASIQAELIRKMNLLGVKGSTEQQNCKSSSDIEKCLEDLLMVSTTELKNKLQKMKMFYQSKYNVDDIIQNILTSSESEAEKTIKMFDTKYADFESEQSTLIHEIGDLARSLGVEIKTVDILKSMNKEQLNTERSRLTRDLEEKKEKLKQLISNIGDPAILSNANIQNQSINKQIEFLIGKEKELQALIIQKTQLFVGLPFYETMRGKTLNLTQWIELLDKEFEQQSKLFERITNGKTLLPNMSIASQFVVLGYQYSQKTVDLLQKLCGSKKTCFKVETMKINGIDMRFLVVNKELEKYIRSESKEDKFIPLDALISDKLDRLKPFYQDYQKYVSFVQKYKPEGFSINSAGKIIFNGKELSNLDLLTGKETNGEWEMGKFQFLDDSIRQRIQSLKDGLSKERQQHFNSLSENIPAIEQLQIIEDISKTEEQLARLIKDQLNALGGSFTVRNINFKSSDFDKNSKTYNPDMVSLFFKEYNQLLNTISSEFQNDKRIKTLVLSCNDYNFQACINLPLLNSFFKTLEKNTPMKTYLSALRFFETIDYEFDDQFFKMNIADQMVVLQDMMASVQQNNRPLFDAAQTQQWSKYMEHIEGLAGAHIDNDFDSFVKEILPSLKDHPFKNSLETAFKKIDQSSLSNASKRQAKYNLYTGFQRLAFFQSDSTVSDFNSILDSMIDSEISFGKQFDVAEKQVLTGSPDEKQIGRADLDALDKARNDQADHLFSQQLDYLIGQFTYYLPDITDFQDGVLSQDKDTQLNSLLNKLKMNDARISLDDPENGMRNKEMSVSEFIKYATMNGWSKDDIIQKLLPIAMNFPVKGFSPPNDETIKGAFRERTHRFLHDAYKRAMIKKSGQQDVISDSDAKNKSADEIRKAGLTNSDLDNFLIMSKSITSDDWNDEDIQSIVSQVRTCMASGNNDCLQKQYLLNGNHFMNFSEIYFKSYELLMTQFGNTKDDLARLRTDMAEAIETANTHLSKTNDPITAQLQIDAMKARLQELDDLIAAFGDNQSGWFKDLSGLFKRDSFSEKDIKTFFQGLKSSNLLNRYNQIFAKFGNIFQRQQVGLEILTSLSPKNKDDKLSDDGKTDVERASEFAQDVQRRADNLETFAQSLEAEASKAAQSKSADAGKKETAAKAARSKAALYRLTAKRLAQKAAELAAANRRLASAESGLSENKDQLDSLRDNISTTPEQISEAERKVEEAQNEVDAASEQVSNTKNDFDALKDGITPTKKDIDELKDKYPFIFQSNNIGILFDPKIQESILKRFKNDPKVKSFFDRYFKPGTQQINWTDLKESIAAECEIDTTIPKIISISDTIVRTMNHSMTDVLIRQIEINAGRTLTREEKDRLYKHIESEQIADETKFKNPLIETYVECLAEPNGKDCFIPTVHSIVLQTATRGLMELFKNLTVANFASLGALSKAFQHISVVSSTYEALKDEKPPEVEVPSKPQKEKEEQVRVRIADKNAQPTRSGETHFSYIWMTPKQQRAAAAETDVRGSKGEFIIKVDKKIKAKTATPTTKTEAPAPKAPAKAETPPPKAEVPKAEAPPAKAEPLVRVRIVDKESHPTRSGESHFTYIEMTPEQQRAAAAEIDVSGRQKDDVIIHVEGRKAKAPEKAEVKHEVPAPGKAKAQETKPEAPGKGKAPEKAEVKPEAKAPGKGKAETKPGKAPETKPEAKAPEKGKAPETKPEAKDNPEIVEIDGQKFQRTSNEDERFIFNPSENLRRFKEGVKDTFNPMRWIKKKKESSKTDRQFEEEQVHKKLDKKAKDKPKADKSQEKKEADKPKDAETDKSQDKPKDGETDKKKPKDDESQEKIDIKFQKKEGKIDEETASVNSENDKKAEQIRGIDLTKYREKFMKYKEQFIKYYQTTKIYTYIHKPLVGAYQKMIDLKNWRPVGVRDFLTNWRSIPMVGLNALGTIYKGMTWLNAKLMKFTSALGDLSTQFVKAMAKWVEEAALLLVSQIAITGSDGQEQSIAGFGIILAGARKIVDKITDQGGKKVNEFAEYVGSFVKQKTRNIVFDIAEDKILGKKETGGWLRWSFDWIKTGVIKILGAVNFVSDKLDQIQNSIASSSAEMWNKFVGINLTASVGKMIADVIDGIPEEIDENDQTHRDALGKAFEKAGKTITPFVDAVQGILKPGGISRFVYIMAKNKETYANYIVFGTQNLPSALQMIRKGILTILESYSMKLAVIADLAVSVVKEIGTIMKSMISNGFEVLKGLLEQISNVASFLASGTGPGGSSFSLKGVRKIWSALSSITGDFIQSFKNLFDVFKLGFLRWVDITISDDWWGLGWVKNKVMNMAIPQNFDNQAENKYNFLAAGGHRNRLKLLPSTTSI